MNDLIQLPFAPELEDFAQNPDPRCPCVLLLDTSGSMFGEKIKHLNEGLVALKESLIEDEHASRRVELAVVSFGPVKIENDFYTAANFNPPELSANGMTPMGEAIELGITMVNERKETYKESGIKYYRPWILLITDGEPTDSYYKAASLVKEGEEKKKFSFFAVGVDHANMQKLAEISVRPPLPLSGLNFRDLFIWLSASMTTVSNSIVGGGAINLPTPTWASVEL